MLWGVAEGHYGNGVSTTTEWRMKCLECNRSAKYTKTPRNSTQTLQSFQTPWTNMP